MAENEPVSVAYNLVFASGGWRRFGYLDFGFRDRARKAARKRSDRLPSISQRPGQPRQPTEIARHSCDVGPEAKIGICVADDAVQSEPVCGGNSLFYREKTGKFAKFGLAADENT